MEQKILIVDDEAHIRMLIEQTLEELEDEGVEFLTAENGEIALAIIQEEQPQLVFLDVMMPKMNGMDVCKRVKKELGLTNVYIALLTAKGQELDRQKGQEVGADIYMTKPFDPEVILRKAREVLGL
ncbi:MAG: response regulator [Chitinophagaceae bacterium]|jgi:two-component system alkaline phosphatase synthesis response regulator PhoP